MIKNSCDVILSEESFDYDAAGNVTSAPDSSFQYDANNRLISFNGNAVSYDLDGNMLSNGTLTCTYDSANRLTSTSANIFFKYPLTEANKGDIIFSLNAKSRNQ